MEREDLIAHLTAWTDGVDPATGAPLPSDHPAQRADTLRVLLAAVGALRTAPSTRRDAATDARRSRPARRRPVAPGRRRKTSCSARPGTPAPAWASSPARTSARAARSPRGW